MSRLVPLRSPEHERSMPPAGGNSFDLLSGRFYHTFLYSAYLLQLVSGFEVALTLGD